MPRGIMKKEDPSQVTSCTTGVNHPGRWLATSVARAESAAVSPPCARTLHRKMPKTAALIIATTDHAISALSRPSTAWSCRRPISQPLWTKRGALRSAPVASWWTSENWGGPVVHEGRLSDPVLDCDLLEGKGQVLGQE